MKTRFLNKWTSWFLNELTQSWTFIFTKPLLLKTSECLLKLALCFVLAGGQLFVNCAPFSLGMVAAAAGLSGFFALVGASLGYIFFLGFTAGIKYVAVALLIFTCSYIFKDLAISKKSFFAPLNAAAMCSVIGFVYIAGSNGQAIVLFITEVILAGCSAYFYKKVFQESGEKRTIGLVILLMTVLISLVRVELVAGISLGRLAATLAVMIAAWQGGLGMGSVAGVAAGIAMDAAGGGQPYFSMAYGFIGLVGGIFSGRKRLSCVLGCILANAVIWAWTAVDSTAVLYEVFVASVLFMIFPESLMPQFSELSAHSDAMEKKTRQFAKSRLEGAAGAFQAVYETLMAVFGHNSTNDNEVATVFDRVADKICKRCPQSGLCWEREYVATFNALNDASTQMLKRGKAEAGDFPVYFSGRCRNFDAFVANVNEELTGLLYRRQYKNRLRESRSVVCRQYSEFSQILSSAAEELSEELTFDVRGEKRLQRYLKASGVVADAAVYSDASGRRHAEIQGKNLSALTGDIKLSEKLSELLGLSLSEPEIKEGLFGQQLSLPEAEPYVVVVGLASKRKEGEAVNGDSGIYFKGGDGKLYVILSDGMGTGIGAQSESTTAIRLLERFLRAGIEAEIAVKTLNSALVLKGDEEGGFATVDMLAINLFTGTGEFFKFGAAPSYVKRSNQVAAVKCHELPAGVGAQKGLRVTRVSLSDGDFVVLASDGAVNVSKDEWLRKAMSAYNGSSPMELAEGLIEKAELQYGRSDDMTVMAIHVKKRGI